MKLFSRFCLVVGAVSSIAIAAAQGPPTQKTVEIHGQVIDAQGKPVPNASLSSGWGNYTWDEAGLSTGPFRALGGIKTDSEGKFKGSISSYRFPTNLTVMNADLTMGTTLRITEQVGNEPLTIMLEPVGKLIINPKVEGLPSENVMLNLSLEPRKGRYATVLASEEITIPLPQGDYSAFIYSMKANSQNKEFSITAGATINWGDVVLEQTTLSKHAGKEPPVSWNVTDARGISKDIQLSDLKGKWVILEFWGYW